MTNIIIPGCILLVALLGAGHAQAQSGSVQDIMHMTLNKLKTSSDAGRTTEKTYSDIFFKDDTSRNNCIFSYRFSSQNAYRINAFALSDKVSGVNVGLYQKDSNGKWIVMGRNSTTGNDVGFRFVPTSTGWYYFIVTGTLKPDVNNALFNLIIERE